MRFEIFKKADNSFSFELLDNSVCILTSPAFASIDEALEAIKKLVQVAALESNYLSFSDKGSLKFSINESGQQLAISEVYESEANRQEAISNLLNDTFQDTDFDVSYTESRKDDKQKLGFIVDINSYDFSRTSSSGKIGFEEIAGGDKSNIFHFNDSAGKAILYSQSYATSTSRSSGIRSVIQNAIKDERFEIFEEGGNSYFKLKAQTGREMARSPLFKSNEEAQAAIDFLKSNASKFAENYPKPEKKFTKEATGSNDNYQFEIASQSGYVGFEVFQSDSNKQHYFHFNDAKAQAILFSQGYQNAKARDNGIKSVIKNATIENRYATIEENGKYYFSLKAGNKQEIARSPIFSSLEELEIAKKYMLENTLNYATIYGVDTNEITKTETFSIHIEKPTLMAEQVQPGDSSSPQSNDSERLDDDYLVCGEYRDRIADSKSTEHPSFIVFTHENGKHYFALLDAAGDLFLRSEGYPTTAARDNGIESVKKNSLLPERFKMEERRDFHYITLRAGNHQEIARSCPYESLADAEARRENHLNPPVIAAAVTATDESDRVDDDYLVCGEYRDRIADSKSDKYPGFISFTHENGKHYFAVLDSDGDLYLRSEGYPTTAARDNGIESVMRNSEIEERYKIEERRGFHFLTLRAGNHQEIARSCPYQHLADAEGRKGKSFAAAGLAVAGLALADVEVVAPEVVVEEPVVEVVAPEVVVAEPIVEVVAPEVVVEEPKVEPIAIAAVTAAIAGATALTADAALEKIKEVHVPEVHKEKEDDYLPCEAYRGHTVNDKNNNLALFKEKGQFYFVFYNKDGSVKLRSEGFKTSKERDIEVSGVLRNLNDKNQYSTIEKAGYVMHVLKDKTGREVGRSCPEKIGAAAAGISLADVAKVAAPVAAVAAATQFKGEAKAAAPIIEEVAETSGGFARFLPWLLGAALLGGLLWWLMKGCDKKVEAPAAAVVAVDSVKVDTVTAAAPVAAPVVACNCTGNEEPIFNIPTGVKAKKLTRLGTNPEFARYADLHAKSPAEFYEFLKERSEKSKVDKTFLDRITKAMGYANGFADVTAAAFSEMEFPVGTTGNLGWGAQHGTAFDELPDNERDRKAFKIAGNGACDIYFMKTCGNHMVPSSNCK